LADCWQSLVNLKNSHAAGYCTVMTELIIDERQVGLKRMEPFPYKVKGHPTNLFSNFGHLTKSQMEPPLLPSMLPDGAVCTIVIPHKTLIPIMSFIISLVNSLLGDKPSRRQTTGRQTFRRQIWTTQCKPTGRQKYFKRIVKYRPMRKLKIDKHHVKNI